MLQFWSGLCLIIALAIRGPTASAAPDPVQPKVDESKMESVPLVVRGIATALPAGPGRGGWPHFELKIGAIYKSEKNSDLKAGDAITLIALSAPTTEATFYLVPDPNYPPHFYRFPDGFHPGDGVSHVDLAANGPATQPETAPAGPGALRAEKLKAGIGQFQLSIWYIGKQDKPFYTADLHVAPMAIKQNDPFNLFLRISPEVAGKMIDLLLADGSLDRAIDTSLAVNRKQTPTVAGYHFTIAESLPTQRIEYDEPIGWNLSTLKKLDALRAVMDGDPGNQMEVLINRLSGLRKQWEKQAAGG